MDRLVYSSLTKRSHFHYLPLLVAKATRGSLLTHNCGYTSKPIVTSRLLGSILTGTCYEYQSPPTLANIPALLSSAVLAPRLFQIQLAHSPLQQLCFLIMVRSFFFFRPAILYFFFLPPRNSPSQSAFSLRSGLFQMSLAVLIYNKNLPNHGADISVFFFFFFPSLRPSLQGALGFSLRP